MSTSTITCEIVDEGDLEARYLAGRLSPDQAEAFEAHFFGCERCWGLVQQGLAVRSAFQPDLSHARPGRGNPRRRWWGLAVAAGIAAIAVGTWQLGDRSQAGPAPDVLRGGNLAFTVVPAATSETAAASWQPVADAEVYRVRLYTADGMLVSERETADTFFSVPLGTVTSVTAGTELFWQVQALDRLRNSVARSDLTRVVIPGP